MPSAETCHEGQKLRQNLLEEYKDKYSNRHLRVSIHSTSNGFWKYAFISWKQILEYMGIETDIIYSMENDLFDKGYDIFVDIIGDKFYISNSEKDFKNDFNIKSIPFGFNPIIYYPEESKEIYDYFFVGTNSYRKVEETKKYLLPIVNHYNGVLMGTYWDESILELHPNDSRFFYNRAKINLNYHLQMQRDSENEINERTFVISACGGFQLVDNPAILNKFYSEKDMAIAKDEKEYADKFLYYLDKTKERQEIGYNALVKTYENKYSLFHRLENILSKVL